MTDDIISKIIIEFNSNSLNNLIPSCRIFGNEINFNCESMNHMIECCPIFDSIEKKMEASGLDFFSVIHNEVSQMYPDKAELISLSSTMLVLPEVIRTNEGKTKKILPLFSGFCGINHLSDFLMFVVACINGLAYSVRTVYEEQTISERKRFNIVFTGEASNPFFLQLFSDASGLALKNAFTSINLHLCNDVSTELKDYPQGFFDDNSNVVYRPKYRFYEEHYRNYCCSKVMLSAQYKIGYISVKL